MTRSIRQGGMWRRSLHLSQGPSRRPNALPCLIMDALVSTSAQINWQIPQSRLGLVGQHLSLGLGLSLEGLMHITGIR